jgi:UDP-N-acetylglucosamine 2-epimerase
LLLALEKFPDYKLILTYPNADDESRSLIRLLESFSSNNSRRCRIFKSMGQKKYLSAMQNCSAVIGNSSSGIIEAPFIGTPTINIGDRQKGRSMAPSIICCDEEYDSIFSALKLSLSKKHLEVTKRKDSPYGKPGAAKKIINILSKTSFDNLIKKKFHLIDVEAFKKNY